MKRKPGKSAGRGESTESARAAKRPGNPGLDCCVLIGRGVWIRTTDPSVPNRVLYQAEPRPDTSVNTYSTSIRGSNDNWSARGCPL